MTRFRLTFAGLLLAMLLASLDQTIVATALPTIVSDLGGLEQLSWVVTAYLVGATVTMPLWGRASDLHGRKPLFLAAIVVFLAGSALSGAAGSIGELIAFRALQGTGAGGLMTLAMAIVAEIV
ncbi:MAG: MFS transporter, partial [Solirubrobacteraceae bacterium]